MTWAGSVAGTDGSVDYRRERMGAGYVVGIDPVPTLAISVRVGGPLSSLRAEAASLYVLVSRTPSDVHLLVFIDCLGLLLILLKWGKADFWPDPNDLVHFDVILPLVTLLRSRLGRTLLFKVKSHSGCLQNERADAQAGQGVTLDEEETCPGPAKYGSLHLRIKPFLRDTAGVALPRDSTPNKTILARVVQVNILKAVKLRNTIFVRDLLLRGQGAAIARTIAKCRDAVIRCWMKAMNGTYPTATYLHRIGKVSSALCPYCSMATAETLTHFMCVCPKFREARTAGHNKAWDLISAFLARMLSSDWRFYKETPMWRIGLKLLPVLADDAPLQEIRVERWQPDAVAVSWTRKKIAIIDLCRPSDVCPEQLKAASNRKVSGYTPLQAALQVYSDAGWQIEILPWVVGIRGLIEQQDIYTATEFLDIPRATWSAAVECTVTASVESLAFMHRVRYSGNNQSQVFDTNDPRLGPTSVARRGQKRQRSSFQENNLNETRTKWKRMATNTRTLT